ncbi:hypothetical protein O181_074724 [Austropuccinia psidii MF-1]|uniref:Uncharacterized protein n=1 Tax=Austropuccinia psidii MF-1 TaxID=1389203 RepID=A0A9Q3F9L8_9BASI|nr:hypothetical protein [Austropuccinia psidii MF-1]
MSLKYEPETSLQTHIHSFQKIFARYNSITVDKELGMSISTVMAAAMFIRSLSNDRELTGYNQKGKGRKTGKKNAKNQSASQGNNKTDSNKRFENLENMIAKLQASMKTQSAHMITEPEKALSSDSNVFVIQ